jgi:hypothetical protein
VRIRDILIPAAVGILGAASGPSTASAATWSGRMGVVEGPRAQAFDGPAVAGRRVYWVQARTAGGTPATLRSRRVTGGEPTAVPIEIPRPEPPLGGPGTPLSLRGVSLRVAGDRAFVSGQWCSELAPDSPCQTGGFSAAYRLTDGALAGKRATGASYLAGPAPLYVVNDGVDRPGPFPLMSELSGPTALSVPAGVGYLQAAGRFVAWVDGTSTRWGTRGDGLPGWETAHVLDAVTGRERYSVSSRSIATRAATSRVTVSEVNLLPDGSLSAFVARRNGRSGIRAVRVDASGVVRRVGRPIAGARYAQAAVYARRTFVFAGGPAPSRGKASPSRRCDGLWVTDPTGRRGRRLATQRSPSRLGLPVAWDGRNAVWRSSLRPSLGDESGLRIDGGLIRAQLSAAGAPSC